MAIFGLAFLALVVLLGIAALVGGIVGLCIIHKKDFPRKGLATGLLIAALVLGALMILLPIGFVGFILFSNFSVVSDFTETDIVIEEPGYPEQSFTADGVVYEMLPVCTNFDYCMDHSEPVFTYTWEDLLDVETFGNLYRVENPQDFGLIWDGCDVLYCPADQTDAVMAYYSGMEEIQWMFFNSNWIEADVWGSEGVPESCLDSVRGLPELWCSDEEEVEVPTDAQHIWISGIIDSDDELILEISFTVALTETEAYLVRREEADMDEFVEYGIPLSDELFSAFNALAASQN